MTKKTNTRSYTHYCITISLSLLLIYNHFSIPKSNSNPSSDINRRSEAINLLHSYNQQICHPNISTPWSPISSSNWGHSELQWAALQSTKIFESGADGSVQSSLNKKQKTILRKAKQLAIQHLQSQSQSQSTQSTQSTQSSPSDHTITGAWKTLHSWDRHDFLILIQSEQLTTTSLVHIPFRGGSFPIKRSSYVVPNTPIAVLTAFACRLETLENYLDITMSTLEHMVGKKRLILVVSECVVQTSTTNVGNVRDPVSKWRVDSIIKQYKKKYVKIRNKQKSIKRIKSTPVIFKVIYLNKPFSRPLALNKAADLLKPNELAIVLDIDMRVSKNFFVHCRTFSIPGKSAYFPFPFVRNRPSDGLKQQKDSSQRSSRGTKIKVSIRKSDGVWDISSHNTFSIYNEDLKGIGNVGSFNPKSLNWGTEDNDLMHAVLDSGIRVMRMYDPTLSHHYHKTVCRDVGKLCLGSSKLLSSDVKLISHWDV